ncbi:TPA: class I SAM-dependent methyltransferase [Candidatus Woesearchaeota archaeon]|nr:class I SAM-dependent methyltransferase [Candidatus Woesearchaeota archaeon]
MGDWESIFRKKGKVFHKPAPGFREFLRLLKNHDVKRVLDLGCGTGRHSLGLAKAGYEVHSCDISRTGVKMTKAWLGEYGLKNKSRIFSCYEKFPFKDGFFDAVLSTQVIHHNYHDKVLFCIREITRVLRPGGLAFITVAARKTGYRSHDAKKVAPHTYIPLDGPEKGLPHFIYNKTLMRKDFKGFRILELELDKGFHIWMIGIKR